MPGMPNMPNMPSMPGGGGGGGFGKLKMIGGGVLTVIIIAGGVGWSLMKGRFIAPKGKSTYMALGLDKSKLDGDKAMTAVAKPATKWKKDAYWWATNYQAVRADGTVDVSKGAEVMYISPSRVTNASKTGRKDSIRKFQFGGTNVDHSRIWNATNQWKNVSPPALPQCTIKALAASLAKDGLTGDKTVRISFDPQFDWGAEQLWHVRGKDPQIDATYSMKTCEKVTPGAPPVAKGEAADEGGSEE